MIKIIPEQPSPPKPPPPKKPLLPPPQQHKRRTSINIQEQSNPLPASPQPVAAKSLIDVPPNNNYNVSYVGVLD